MTSKDRQRRGAPPVAVQAWAPPLTARPRVRLGAQAVVRLGAQPVVGLAWQAAVRIASDLERQAAGRGE